MSGDNSKYWRSAGFAADHIQALEADGFQVGTNSLVNQNAKVFAYLALKTASATPASTFVPQITFMY